MTFLLSLLLRAAPWLIGLALIVATGIGIHHAGEVDATAKTSAAYEAKIATLRAAAQALHDQEVELAHAAEQKKALDIQAIEAKHIEEVAHEKEQSDRVIADMRSGALQLRKRLAATPSRVHVSYPAAGAARCDDPAPTGLQPEDAEFFVREASRANEIVLQLKACQAVIPDDRK